MDELKFEYASFSYYVEAYRTLKDANVDFHCHPGLRTVWVDPDQADYDDAITSHLKELNSLEAK